MRLDLKDILYVPDAKKPFCLELDLTDLEFYGHRPVLSPVHAQGQVVNHAGALMLEGEISAQLHPVCDRCGQSFQREMNIPLAVPLANELEDEEHDEIVLLEDGGLDLEEAITTAFILAMDTKNLCSEDCKGLCARCGADLNLGPCQCKPEVDPRLAALAQLLEQET